MRLIRPLTFHFCLLVLCFHLSNAQERKTKSKTKTRQEEAVMEEIALISELSLLVGKVKGGDKRLVRHNTLEHSHEAREIEGTCDKLYHALMILADERSHPTDKTIYLICEFATLCVTDHPSYRELFAGVDGIHQKVIANVESKDPRLSAKAAHVIYITSFANRKNQDTYFRNGAVEALSKVIKHKYTKPVQKMFAFAALQNLAASYCTFSSTLPGEQDIEEHSSCIWAWNLEEPHIVMDTTSQQKMLSDGSKIRKAIIRDKILLHTASEWACRGPVQGEPTEDNVFPGYNAISTGRDDDKEQIVPWAAAGLLKNLALDPDGREFVERSIMCFCRMMHSPDWLEESKAEDILHHLRRERDPCWYDHEDPTVLACVDLNFLDKSYGSCEDYENAFDDECGEQEDVFHGFTAQQACCGCGGGYQFNINHEEL